MELIFSSGVLTFLLLVGAFADFLVNPSPKSVYHGDDFGFQPKSLAVAQTSPDFEPGPEPQYERAA